MNEFENYIQEQKTIDLVKANVYSIVGLIPIAILYFVPFYLLWKDRLSFSYLKENVKELSIGMPMSLIIFLTFVIGIILHELIHGLTWSLFAKHGFKSMKFGILLKMLTPYCHCKEPLKVNQYIIGAAMPSLILGLLPAIISTITGNLALLLFGALFTIMAIGDFMIINLLKSEDKILMC